MKKLAFFLAVLLLLTSPMDAFATTRSIRVVPSLNYTGVTANCTVSVLGENTSDHIQATVQLMFGFLILI